MTTFYPPKGGWPTKPKRLVKPRLDGWNILVTNTVPEGSFYCINLPPVVHAYEGESMVSALERAMKGRVVKMKTCLT